jgi:hypothetical protein
VLHIATQMKFDNAVILPRPVLRISYDNDMDVLRATVAGEVIDSPLEDETEVFAHSVDEDGDLEECAWLYTRGPDGPLIGFEVRDALEWEIDHLPMDEAPWCGPTFDVPTLALRDATIGQILLAARNTLVDSTPDIIQFDGALAARRLDDPELAEECWRACLACGEMKAHYGLGYTLVELDRPREAFGHLAMYTEIAPRLAWAWFWRGRAAHVMGELDEARRCYERALECEAEGSDETDASWRIIELDEEE